MSEDQMTPEEWVGKFAQEVGDQSPSDEQFAQVLRLAGVAAHASQRTAAPVACWIAGRTGLPLNRAIEIAESVARPNPDSTSRT